MPTTRVDDWRRVREIFEAALTRPLDDRETFLAEACGDDLELRREVVALLASHDSAATFLENPAVSRTNGPSAKARPDTPDSMVGRVIGPYLIESCIGHGGMGSVYIARRADRAFERRVAIKMIRRGMDTDIVIQRFEHERQILASLDHPHIARLYDGGTTPDGMPYFVMEYVEGEPITDYCTRHRLGTKARLEMFRAVCRAVQYAHQNLVVHRDLKPANILVGADGEPKLLDFGIAKLLAGSDAAVASGATLVSALTPDYASPEQVRGQLVTTASDVYSLGIVLYELLAARRPFVARAGSLEELVRTVCEADAQPPSTVVQHAAGESCACPPKDLRGDLDTIVLRALRKEPARRYASPADLAADVGRYLERKPVAARGDALTYRAAKFAERHWAAVLVAGIFVATLLSSMVLIVRQSRIAEEQRSRAERRFADVRRLAGSFLFEVHDAIQYLPGATRARQLVTTRAVEYLDGLANEAADDPTLQAELAQAYRRVGEVLGNSREANLGNGEGALASYRKAVALEEALVRSEPSNSALQLDLAQTLLGFGDVQFTIRDISGALGTYRRALTLAEQVAAVQPKNRDRLRLVASAHYRVGDALRQLDKAAARDSVRRALVILEPLAADATDLESRRLLARGYRRLGTIQVELGEGQESVALQQRGLELNESLAAGDPQNMGLRTEVAMSHTDLGRAYLGEKRLGEALASYQRAAAITQSMAAADPNNAQARWLHGLQLNSIGFLLGQMKREAEAVASHAEALELFDALARSDPANATFQYNVANTHQLIGDAYASMSARADAARQPQAWRNACASYQKSADLFEKMRREALTDRGSADAQRASAAVARCKARPTPP